MARTITIRRRRTQGIRPYMVDAWNLQGTQDQ